MSTSSSNADSVKEPKTSSPNLMTDTPKNYPAFTADQTKFIIRRRLEMTTRFQKASTKSGSLWVQITAELKEEFAGLPHDSTSVSKRYANMLTKYKEEQKKASKSGAQPSTWEYYTAFHEVLHTRPDISLATMSTTKQDGIDMPALPTINFNTKDGRAGRKSRDSSEERQFLHTVSDEELPEDRERSSAPSASDDKRGKKASASKERHQRKRPKVEGELQGFIAAAEDRAKDYRLMLEKAADDQAKRDEETRAYRKEALEVGRLLAEGLKSVGAAFKNN